MQLKTLSIKGFKSFADKTIVNFNQNITGIVGPNGCGKSNIVDAIRWVLGEQKSRELRSEKMSNVIFAGTKKRKAGGLAEVSLTFENTRNLLPTEYHTVTITRMLYRSGESEYRLNNVPCRLKDIKTLLMDTGIGSNSYAIIALGMVDDLLNDHENSRRRLFEQAAGISKFKIRKRETFNKLKGTEADLDRVEDLLFEIEGNLKTLEKQAKRAKKYFEHKENYKALSIELAVYRLIDFKAIYKGLKEKIQSESDNKLKLETTSKKSISILEKEKASNLEKEKELSDKQKGLNKLIGITRSKENDKKVLEQKVNFITQNETNLFRQIESGQTNLQQNETDIVYYRTEINTEKKIEEKLETQLEAAEAQLKKIRDSHGSLKTELDDFMREQQAQERQIFELEKKKAIQSNQKENIENELRRNEEEIKRRTEDLKSLKGNFKKLSANRNEKEELIVKLEKQENERQVKIESTEEELEKIKQEIVLLNRQLDSKQNEYKLTKSLVDNLEGFPESIKFLSKNKTWGTNAPLLSDVIYCKKDYRIAIENYLDNYLNYYVVKNLQEALKAISLLEKSQKGKANFFLLDQLPTLELRTAPPQNTVSALEVVEVEESYQRLCYYLLDKVFLTDKESADDLQNENPAAIILSKSGKFVKSRFAISGGSVGLFEGKRIGRKKNLEVLSKEIAKLEANGKKLSASFEKTHKSLNDLKKATIKPQIEVEKVSLGKLQQEAATMQANLENYETFLNNVLEKKKQSLDRIKEIETENKKIEVDLKATSKKAATLKKKIEDMDSSYKDIADALSKASTEYNQKNIEFIRQQNKINALQRELSFREKQISDIRTKLEQDQLSRQSSQADLAKAKEDIVQLDIDLVQCYKDKKAFETNLNDFEQNYYQSRGTINEQEDTIRKLTKSIQDSQSLLESLREKYSEVRIELHSIGERMKIEFGIEVNEIMNNDPNPDFTMEELEEKVAKLKVKIENYGEINPMAVEAYDEMNERYQFISAQRNDLREAKDSLLKTIEEIEITATAQFMEAFHQVRENFKIVFRSLFTEDDNCDLMLEDPENPLESPIKITAKPKGKRPQSINQLSGGEKTLTATALLFALYLLKPAPFCIFDEVDAPLDDANIGKFNKIISKFSDDSQFIIVTHNKQTMASVDVIYGVTMAEQGVSRVVPVDFRSLG